MSNTFILVIYNDSISMWILYSKSKWLGHLKTKYKENFVDESLNGNTSFKQKIPIYASELNYVLKQIFGP